jgi:hypothetical protein
MLEGSCGVVKNMTGEKGMTILELIAYLEKLNPEMQVWLKVSDDPERCYSLLKKDDITIEKIWLCEEPDPDDGGIVEVPGVVIGERRIQT